MSERKPPRAMLRGSRGMIVALFAPIVSFIASHAAPSLRVTTFSQEGVLAWTSSPVPGICTVQVYSAPAGPWTYGQNAFATNSAGTLTVPSDGETRFYRMQGVGVPPTPQGFTNLVRAYGLLETIAGNGLGGWILSVTGPRLMKAGRPPGRP